MKTLDPARKTDDQKEPGGGPTSTHVVNGTDPYCKTCQHKMRETIETLFMRWTPMTDLAELAEISAPSIKRHMRAVGLMQKRAENTEDLIAHALDSGFDRNVFSQLDGDQLVRLIQWQDKKLGKVKEHHNNERPTQVFFIDIPAPGGVVSETKAVELAKTIRGRVLSADTTPMLPPGDDNGSK